MYVVLGVASSDTPLLEVSKSRGRFFILNSTTNQPRIRISQDRELTVKILYCIKKGRKISIVEDKIPFHRAASTGEKITWPKVCLQKQDVNGEKTLQDCRAMMQLLFLIDLIVLFSYAKKQEH